MKDEVAFLNAVITNRTERISCSVRKINPAKQGNRQCTFGHNVLSDNKRIVYTCTEESPGTTWIEMSRMREYIAAYSRMSGLFVNTTLAVGSHRMVFIYDGEEVHS